MYNALNKMAILSLTNLINKHRFAFRWLKRKLSQLPKRYEVFTEKALKLQKRCLISRAKDRWAIKDIKRYLETHKLLKPPKTPQKHSGGAAVAASVDMKVRKCQHKASGSNRRQARRAARQRRLLMALQHFEHDGRD